MSEQHLYRRGQIWWARAQLAGRDIRRSLRTSDRQEARRRLKTWLAEIEHIRFHGEPRHTWKSAVIRYAAESLPGLRASTAERYRLSLRMVDPILGELRLEEITRKTLAAVVSHRKRDGATNATIRRDLTAISGVLRAATAWQWVDENVALTFDRGIIRERRPPFRVPPDSEVAAVIRAAPEMMGRLLLLLLQTGMREAEAGALERAEVSIARREVALRHTKTNRPRIVPLTEAAAGTIAGTPVNLKTRRIFWHGKGEPYLNLPTNLAKLIGRVLDPEWHKRRAPGAPKPPRREVFHPHSLRHKFAIEWLSEHPGHIYELQQILGHTSVKTTEIYLAHVARNPAQAHRSDDDWTHAKPLRHMSYLEVLRTGETHAQQVL